jgi:hypothetical protein
MSKRSHIKFLLDVVMLLLLVGLVATGVLLLVVLPRGGGCNRQVLWGVTRLEWGVIHHVIGAGFVFCVLIHVGLNWNWVLVSFMRIILRRKKIELPSENVRWFAALAMIILLVAVIFAFIALCRSAAGT